MAEVGSDMAETGGSLVSEVEIPPVAPQRYLEILGPVQRDAFATAIRRARSTFAGRSIVNVNSTAAGGGVAEMLRSLLAYARGAGVDARWLVVSGPPEFFRVTKRIHNHLHEFSGDGGPLGAPERAVYEQVLEANFDELQSTISRGDLVILHDPQTAGLIPSLRRRGHRVVWRCHVGIDSPGDRTRHAWEFLRPYVAQADACVFSRERYVWDQLDDSRVQVIPPSIDAFSAKNCELEPPSIGAILHASGVIDGMPSTGSPTFPRQEGGEGVVERRARMIELAPVSASDRLVVQVSRWDDLKDPLGVIDGFARYVAPHSDAHLVYAGPELVAVADDPEGQAVLDRAVALFESLPVEQRRRVHLACLPMVDDEENAAIVNALQRHSYLVVQKSLAEGFGLTVAEAMWKGRPVVASRVGGIRDQIEDGVTGVLLEDSSDLEAYGRAVMSLLDQPERAQAIGIGAMDSVRDQFLGARSLLQYWELLQQMIAVH